MDSTVNETLFRLPGLLPQVLEAHGLEIVAVLGASLELQALTVSAPGELGSEALLDPATVGLEETPAATELRRAIVRAGIQATRTGRNAGQELARVAVEARLGALSKLWRRSRSSVAILRLRADSRGSRPGPRLFVDRVGSNAVEVSWEPLGGVGLEAQAFEVELRGLRCSSNADGNQESAFALGSLGRFLVPGGGSARSHTVRRLRPLQRHRARVRALGPGQSWASNWSNEVTFMTLSIEAARVAGRRMTADGFFAPSEQNICGVVQSTGTDDGIEAADLADLLPTPEEVSQLRAQGLRDLLSSAFGPESEDVVKEMLDARSCRGGWQEFVRHGTRYSRPPADRQRRMQRMRLVIAAQELYKPEYAEGNVWHMGPFFYDEPGRSILEKGSRTAPINERAEAARRGGA